MSLCCLIGHVCKLRNHQGRISLIFQKQRQLFPNGWVILYYHNFLHIAITALPFTLCEHERSASVQNS